MQVHYVKKVELHKMYIVKYFAGRNLEKRPLNESLCKHVCKPTFMLTCTLGDPAEISFDVLARIVYITEF